MATDEHDQMGTQGLREAFLGRSLEFAEVRVEAAEQRVRELEGELANVQEFAGTLKGILLGERDAENPGSLAFQLHDTGTKLATAVEALRQAERGLMKARNGLDLGLGCARDVEDDRAIRAIKPRSRRQEAYLEDARQAHGDVRRALSEIEQGDAQ